MPRFIFIIAMISAIATPQFAQQTRTGLDRIAEFQRLFANKRVGLIVNQTSLNRRGEHATDIFRHLPTATVTALFGPEHGVRGRAANGVRVGDDVDAANKIPVYSLYGKTKKPTPDMLKNVDLLVFDMQDIGARFYTYIWTMYYVMQSAAENDIPIIVLDRPNPITGKIEGPVLQQEFSSFIGLQPIPVRHGMTIGELAQLFNGEGLLGNGLRVDLTVIPMQGWRRNMWFDETGLPFTPPSPNMPNLETAAVYPGLCLLEGTNVSEGRGTDAPFLTFGAPWIDGDDLCEKLREQNIAGLTLESTAFTPKAIPGKALQPKFENQRCSGVRLTVACRDSLNSFLAGLIIIKTLHDVYPEKFSFRRDGYFDLLCGTDGIRTALERGDAARAIQASWRGALDHFKELRKKYLLYPECKADNEQN